MFDIARLKERELLIQVASGNEYAFRQLFMAHHQQLGVHMFRITNSAELTEEIVQDVFLKYGLPAKPSLELIILRHIFLWSPKIMH